MELDVNLVKNNEEPWGFRLIGGVDFKMPLTVVKVLPESVAEKAGLQNGDTLLRLNDTVACDLSHDEARLIVEAASEKLTLGVKRGLYDPVLDDYEPIYEIDQDGSDRPSQPSEVDFKIQKFLDPNQDVEPRGLDDLSRGTTPFYDPKTGEQGLNGEVDPLKALIDPVTGLTIVNDLTRSLTASPFVPSSKPYRPFSTEPLEVPPLEDPIILNPNYHDEFKNLDDVEVDYEVLSIASKLNDSLKYKLPISKQYDPSCDKKDGRQSKIGERDATITKEEQNKVKNETAIPMNKKDDVFGYTEVVQTKELKEMEFKSDKMQSIDVKQENMDNIEITANNIVDESIIKAMNVAEEIRNAINIELDLAERIDTNVMKSEVAESIKTDFKVDKLNVMSEKTEKLNETQSSFEVKSEKIEHFDESDIKVSKIGKITKEIKKFEMIYDRHARDEKKKLTEQEISEVIEEGSVRRKSKIFDNENIDSEAVNVVNKKLETREVKETKKETANIVREDTSGTHVKPEIDAKSYETKTKHVESKKVEVNSQTTTEAGQRSYKIGLQTIPNIRGTLHNNCHYNLLLKTFFIHLTDVMVALSRFILSEPVFDKCECANQKMAKDEVISESKAKSAKEDISYESKVERQDVKSEHKLSNKVLKEVKDVQVQKKVEEVTQENKVAVHEQNELKVEKNEVKEALTEYEVIDKSHKRAKSGCEMAQLTEKKSNELTVKMEAVITEFENKTGLDETEEVKERRRRSRSRSHVEEEKREEVTELNMTKREFSSKVETAAKQKIEREERVDTTTTAEAGKQMYVAIVESHVFTNKDAIFERTAEIAKTTVENAEKLNIAIEANQAISTEKVAVSSEVLNTAKAVEQSHVDEREVKKEIVEKKVEPIVVVKEHKKEISEETKVSAKSSESKTQSVEITEIIDNKIESVNKEVKSSQVTAIESKKESVGIIDITENKVKEITKTAKKDVEAAKEVKVAKKEEINISADVKIEKKRKSIEPKVELAALKIVKENVIEVQPSPEIVEKAETKILTIDEMVDLTKVDEAESLSKYVDISSSSSMDSVPDIVKTPTKETLTSIIENTFEQAAEKSATDVSFTATTACSCDTTLKSESISQAVSSSQESYTAKAVALKTESQEVTQAVSEQESSFTAKLATSSKSESQFQAVSTIAQESSFTAKLAQSFETSTEQESLEAVKTSSISKSEDTLQAITQNNSILDARLERQASNQSDDDLNNNIGTPNSTVPPTPVTDEYVFKLEIALPKNITPIKEPSPDLHEDPNIVKKKLVPHIDATVESPIIYDPPLSSPIEDIKPVYTKPGLRGGCSTYRREEILEIGRKSSLLASAIDETIKSIEEYKEQVGMEMKREGNSKTEYTKVENIKEEYTVPYSDNKVEMDEEWTKVNKQVEENNKNLNDLLETTVNGSNTVEITEITDSKNSVDIQECILDETKSNINSNLKTEDIKVVEVNNQNDDVNNSQFSVDTQVYVQETKVNVTSEKNESNNEEIVFATKQELNNDITIPETNKNGESYSENVLNLSQNNQKDEGNIEKVVLYESTQNGVNFNTKQQEVTCNGNMSVEMNNKLENPVNDNLTINNIEHIIEGNNGEVKDPMAGYRPVHFDPDECIKLPRAQAIQFIANAQDTGRAYVTASGELIGTVQGIIDGLEDATVDEELAKELGKPGMTEEKIAELISGESEMLREAHVMGLSRVLTSHMNRLPDDSSVDFKKIKPIIESLKYSEVLKALNDELTKTKAEKKKDERKWTKFLQKPQRPVPRVKFGYHGYVEIDEDPMLEPYKVKIVKQPKPKVAPDYKPENFDTGPLPWEERALNEPPLPPVEAEDPILIPEEVPEFLEAVDPLPESEVPDLEQTGITLPDPKEEIQTEPVEAIEEEVVEEIQEDKVEEVAEPVEEKKEEMENRIADQLMNSVQNMVDPNATLEQQLSQMRAQLAALAQLPGVIQQTLEMVTRQLGQLTQESVSVQSCEIQEITEEQETEAVMDGHEEAIIANHNETIIEESEEVNEQVENTTVEEKREMPSLTQEELERMKAEEEEMLEEKRRIEKQKKEVMERQQQEHEARQIKQRPTPRAGKPKPVFGPPNPEDRPLVLTGGRKWRGPKDVYDEQMFSEAMSAQAELIQGKALGINFMKYEKPPVSLDHLQNSETYKLIHNMEQTACKRVEMLTPVIAEADYREKCRSISPCVGRMAKEQHLDIPQQVQP